MPYLLLLMCFCIFVPSLFSISPCLSKQRRKRRVSLLIFLHLSKREQRCFDVYARVADPKEEGGNPKTWHLREELTSFP